MTRNGNDDGKDGRLATPEPTHSWQGNEIVSICRDCVDPTGVWYGGIWRINRDGSETRTGCFSQDRKGDDHDE
jgi:hypothetical protein